MMSAVMPFHCKTTLKMKAQCTPVPRQHLQQHNNESMPTVSTVAVHPMPRVMFPAVDVFLMLAFVLLELNLLSWVHIQHDNQRQLPANPYFRFHPGMRRVQHHAEEGEQTQRLVSLHGHTHITVCVSAYTLNIAQPILKDMLMLAGNYATLLLLPGP